MIPRRAVFLCTAAALAGAEAWAEEPIADIEGELPQDLREKIELQLELVEGPARSRAQARRRLERTANTVRTVLRSEGYYDSDMQGRIAEEDPDAEPGRQPPLEPVLLVDPGPRYTVGEAEVVFTDPVPESDAAAAELDLRPGEPAVAARIVAAGLRVTNWLEQHGYPEARLGERDVVVDHDRDAVDVDYPVTPGPKVRFGDVIVTGDAKIGSGWIDLITPFEEGDVFDERELDLLTSRVAGTGVFAQAVATLDRADDVSADGTVTRNVILNIEQGDRNTIAGSVGYSTTEGSGVEIIYERRNFIGYAQTLTATLTAKTNEIGGGVDYRLPYFMKPERNLVASVEAVRQDNEAFTGERATARALVGEIISPRFRVGAGVGVEASNFTQDGIERQAYIAELLAQGWYDARDNRLDPTRGFQVTGEVVPSYNFGDESAFFTRVEADASAYRSVGTQWVLAGRVAAGSAFGTSLDNIPFNRRFYAGGGGSVRGFGFQEIGPLEDLNNDGDFEPTGGRSVVEGSVEARYRHPTLFGGNLGGAVFVDAASIAEPSLSDFRDIRYGAGVGIRYYTPFAPMRADIAFPLNPRDGDDAFQVYISIGQAF